jgi:hypothetical protein
MRATIMNPANRVAGLYICELWQKVIPADMNLDDCPGDD